MHSICTDADQSTVDIHYSLFITISTATVMSKVTQHTRTSYSMTVMSYSESRGCSTSSAGAVDQDMCLASLVILEVMLIVEKVTEAEADGLCRIIEQQANEIVELQNKIKVLEQDLASAKSELQGKERHSQSTHFQMINQVVQVLCREMCLIQCGVGLNQQPRLSLCVANKESGQGTSSDVSS